MENRDCAAPVAIRNGIAKTLQRLSFREREFDEKWLQKLLFENPALLPFSEIEPAFEGSIPIVRELPTGAGPVDLLCVNSKGYLSLVETKLWRNPEARRSVVAQIIDYATAMSAWTYEDLLQSVQLAGLNSRGGDPFAEVFAESEDFDSQSFVDRVTRNLMKGRFLLMIVGDGIQEGVEKMSAFLQQTPHLGYTLGLVEMAVFREDAGENGFLYVQPRIIARTREIVRAVVEVKVPIKPGDIEVRLPLVANEKTGSGRRRITEEEFIESVGKTCSSDVVELVRWVLDHAEEHEIRADWRDAGPVLKYDDPVTEEFFTLGQLHREGTLGATRYLGMRFRKLGWPLEACHSYLKEVAELIPGASFKTVHEKNGDWDKIAYGNSPKARPPLDPLATRKEDWMGAMDRLIQSIKALVETQE